MRRWCPGAELNHRHTDFQSVALPTELPGRSATGAYRGGSGRCPAERYLPSLSTMPDGSRLPATRLVACRAALLQASNEFCLTMFMVRSIRT